MGRARDVPALSGGLGHRQGLFPRTTEGYSLPGGTKYDEQPSIILGIGGQLDDAGQVLVVAGRGRGHIGCLATERYLESVTLGRHFPCLPRPAMPLARRLRKTASTFTARGLPHASAKCRHTDSGARTGEKRTGFDARTASRPANTQTVLNNVSLDIDGAEVSDGDRRSVRRRQDLAAGTRRPDWTGPIPGG